MNDTRKFTVGEELTLPCGTEAVIESIYFTAAGGTLLELSLESGITEWVSSSLVY